MVAIVPQANTQPIGEKRVTLRGLNWQAYQQILHALPQIRGARLTYDRGILEITMPLEDHEYASELIGLFIRILVNEMSFKLKSMRSTTLNREDLERGAEPDKEYLYRFLEQAQQDEIAAEKTFRAFVQEKLAN
jgi:Uma2 family endonuclease